MNISNKCALPIRIRFLCSTINKRKKELQLFSKELSLSEHLLNSFKSLPKQLSTIELYILTMSITTHGKKSLQKSL